MKREDAKNLVIWFGKQVLERMGFPSRIKRSKFLFPGMKRKDAKNLVLWFGNQLFEGEVDSSSWQALFLFLEMKKKDARNPNFLFWKPTVRGCGRFPDVAALKLSAPKDEKRGCKKTDFFGLENNL